MIIQLILLQLLAHILGDFIFQSEKLSSKKESKNLKVHFLHSFTIGIFSLILSFDFGFWLAAIIIAVSHWVIDYLKSHFNSSTKNKFKSSTYFFIDQFAHLLIILIVVITYNNYFNISYLVKIPDIKTLSTIIAFIFCMKPTNIIILNLFSIFKIRTPSETSNNAENISLENAGKLIGIMERMITLVLILNNQYEAVGLVIAA